MTRHRECHRRSHSICRSLCGSQDPEGSHPRMNHCGSAMNFRTVFCQYMSVPPLPYPLYSLSCSESFIQLHIPGSFCVCLHACFYVFDFHQVCFSIIGYLYPQSTYNIWGHFGTWTWENRRHKKHIRHRHWCSAPSPKTMLYWDKL
jgi:hypothetical protein